MTVMNSKMRVFSALSVSGLLLASATIAGCGKTAPTGSAATTPSTAPSPLTTPAPTTPPPPTTTTTTLPPQEQNAIAAAQQYLSMGSGFSQAGLIDQLSSSAGDGYPAAIAAAAVASLNVDWNAQAVLAAKAYMKTSPFSCVDLEQQLDSPSGSQFTAAEAQYAAQQVGLC